MGYGLEYRIEQSGEAVVRKFSNVPFVSAPGKRHYTTPKFYSPLTNGAIEMARERCLLGRGGNGLMGEVLRGRGIRLLGFHTKGQLYLTIRVEYCFLTFFRYL